MSQLATGGSRHYIPVRTQEITAFPFGTIDTIADQSLPQGAASASQNWLTYGDRIELRRGYALLGTENTGAGEIFNTGVAEKSDGTQVLYRKNGRKLEYYDNFLGTRLFEHLSDNNDNDYFGTIFNADGQLGQTFTPSVGHTITTIKLKLSANGTPGTITLSLQDTASGKPTGNILSSTTFDGNLINQSSFNWYQFTLPSYALVANTQYAIVITCAAANPNEIQWAYDNLETTPYSGGTRLNYSAGVWNILGTDFQFEELGSASTAEWVEVGSNIFPVAAINDYASFANYASLAGNQFFVCSPNSGPFKIMSANPGDYTDLTDASKNFQGYIKIKQNRMFLWGRLKDKTGVYGSYIDAAAYTTVSNENSASGDGATKTFLFTLAFKAGGTVRTCFALSITDGVETFTDNYDGTLTGSLGGTGTVNYTTGAISVTFNTAPANAANNIKSSYQWENSNNTGITDFTKSSPRTAGQGFVFRQDDGGGALMNVLSYGDTEYCMHETKTWALTLTSNDTNATNLIYRDRVGIPNWQAACETGSGIFYVDYTDQADPQVRLLTLNRLGTDVVPISISKARKLAAEGTIIGLDLSNYRFDKAVLREWGDFILIECRYKDSTKNDTLITYNKIHGVFDKHTLSASSLVIYNGTLVAGDSVSSNNYTLFSGFDDDDSLINNSWEGALSDFGTDYIKKVKKFVVAGKIQASQSFDIYIALDNGSYTLAGSITGNGSYVDAGNPYLVGTETIGSHVIGDGGDGVNAFNYEHILTLRTDKFNRIKLKFVATGIGFLSINFYKWFDIRLYAKKELSKYR